MNQENIISDITGTQKNKQMHSLLFAEPISRCLGMRVTQLAVTEATCKVEGDQAEQRERSSREGQWDMGVKKKEMKKRKLTVKGGWGRGGEQTQNTKDV